MADIKEICADCFNATKEIKNTTDADIEILNSMMAEVHNSANEYEQNSITISENAKKYVDELSKQIIRKEDEVTQELLEKGSLDKKRSDELAELKMKRGIFDKQARKGQNSVKQTNNVLDKYKKALDCMAECKTKYSENQRLVKELSDEVLKTSVYVGKPKNREMQLKSCAVEVAEVIIKHLEAAGKDNFIDNKFKKQLLENPDYAYIIVNNLVDPKAYMPYPDRRELLAEIRTNLGRK